MDPASPLPLRVLVAGGGGVLGRTVIAGLKRRGAFVRVLARSRARASDIGGDELHVGDVTVPASLAGACRGIDVVFSAVGQSVLPDPALRRPGYRAVDTAGNLALLQEATRSGARRFVYVSVFGSERFPDCAYMAAHAEAAAAIRASALSWAIVQPTGFAGTFLAFLDLARQGRAVVFGDGSARSNPIDEADLAEVCLEGIYSKESSELAAGGPDVHTRREVFELAFAALGKAPRIRTMPPAVLRVASVLLKLPAPRIAELCQFFAVVSTNDFVAPVRGSRRLQDVFARAVANADPGAH